MGKPRLHGRDHRPGGTDALTSGNTTSGYLLAATGAGETRWDPPNASGIQFDTDPQTGTWLLVTTTGTHTSGSSNGIQLKSTGGDILIDADDNTARVFGAAAFVDVSGTLGLTSAAQAYLAGITSAELTGGDGTDPPNYSSLFLNSSASTLKTRDFQVVHPSISGAVFEVLYNGSSWEYHIKTGGAWVADL